MKQLVLQKANQKTRKHQFDSNENILFFVTVYEKLPLIIKICFGVKMKKICTQNFFKMKNYHTFWILKIERIFIIIFEKLMNKVYRRTIFLITEAK